MTETEMMRVRVEPQLERQAERVFRELGLSVADAITLFYQQVAAHGTLPFEYGIPNSETVEALRQARSGEGLVEHATLDDLKTWAQ